MGGGPPSLKDLSKGRATAQLPTPEYPDPLDPAKVAADSLAVQLQYAPEVYDANAKYMPLYANLATNVAGQVMPALANQQADANTIQRTADISDVRNLGGQALEAWRAANPQLQDAQGRLSGAIDAAGAAGTPQVGRYQATAPGMAGPTAISKPALGDSTYASQPTLGRASRIRSSTAAGSGLMGGLESDAGANLGQVSPLQLRLQQQAMEQLGAGLSPGELAKVQQDTRAAHAARGMYDSNQAIGAEILNTDAARRQRSFENAGFAQGVDASGQQQLAAGRNYAGSVAGLGNNLSQFNAGQRQAASTTNAGAANQFALSRYNTAAGLNQFNAGAANQFDLARYGTEAGLNSADADAANRFALTQYGTEAGMSQFNAGQNLQTDQLNTGLQMQGRQQNIANLYNLVSQYANTAQDPYQMVLNRSGSPAAAGAIASNAGPSMFDPFNSGITSIFAGNQANAWAQGINQANTNASTISSNNQMGLSAGMMMFCWVARAAYGAANPRWLRFRRWMLQQAPAWLHALYVEHGPAAAERIAADPALAARARRVMDRILKEAAHA
jgi:hypothetical protein